MTWLQVTCTEISNSHTLLEKESFLHYYVRQEIDVMTEMYLTYLKSWLQSLPPWERLVTPHTNGWEVKPYNEQTVASMRWSYGYSHTHLENEESLALPSEKGIHWTTACKCLSHFEREETIWANKEMTKSMLASVKDIILVKQVTSTE